MPRLFFALELPDDVRSRVAELSAELRRTGVQASFVPAENLHVTMKFLGEIPEPKIARLGEAALELAHRVVPFEVKSIGAGAFPGPARPRVLWAGCRTDSEEPARLAAELERLGVKVGVPVEKRAFRLHLTVARLRTDRGPRPPAALAACLETWRERAFGAFRCDSLTLFESQLGGGPARYAVRARYPFRVASGLVP